MRPCARFPWHLLLAFAACRNGFSAGDTREFNVNVDVTEEGRKVQHPTPVRPAYYYPVVIGYRELGGSIAGDKPPPILDVVHRIALALAEQGYIASQKAPSAGSRGRAGRGFDSQGLIPRPSLILVIHWGSLNPATLPMGKSLSSTPVLLNEEQMLALVGGNTLRNLDLDFAREQVIQGALRNRYFVGVAAFDFDSYIRRHKRVMLWNAKMSVPSAAATLTQVMPSLVASGEPLFGRETLRPKFVVLPVVPAGKVEVGEPVVKGTSETLPSSPAK